MIYRRALAVVIITDKMTDDRKSCLGWVFLCKEVRLQRRKIEAF